MNVNDHLAIVGGLPAVPKHGLTAWPPVSARLEERILAALRSGQLTYSRSSVTRKFEEAFAAYHGRGHALALCSGTVSILTAFYGLGIGRMFDTPSCGEAIQVIVPAYGFFATASPLLLLGVEPVFCDVEIDTGNINIDLAERLVTTRTRAIVVTHLAGHPVDMDRAVGFAQKHELLLIEDCSHAHGATYRGRLVGTFGHAAAWSLQSGKMLSGGEGGVVVTNDSLAFRRMAALANFRGLEGTGLALPSHQVQTGLGLKLRISPLSAVMAHHYLDELSQLIEARRIRLDHLTERLNGFDRTLVQPPVTRPDSSRGAFYEYAIRLQPAVLERVPRYVFECALRAEGVRVRRSNTRAIHRQPLFCVAPNEIEAFSEPSSLVFRPPAPVAEQIEREAIYLPTLTLEPDSLIEAYADAIIKVCRQLDLLADDYRYHPAKYSCEDGVL